MDFYFPDGNYLAFLSTVDEEGKPHVRPVMGIVAERKIYFSTKPVTKKAREIATNPTVELIIPEEKDEEMGYLRVSGEAFRIFEERFVEEILARSAYSPNRYIIMAADETVCLFELIPTKVDQYIPREKRERDVTGFFFHEEEQ